MVPEHPSDDPDEPERTVREAGGGARGAGSREEDERSNDERAEPAPDTTARRSLLPEDHWSRTRTDRNAAEIEYLRSKSRVPGMDGAIAERNHYCMECGGVIPLLYDRSSPADRAAATHCPHCGAELDANVRAMFNWVEIDQVHSSDAAAVLPLALGALALVVLVVVAIVALS